MPARWRVGGLALADSRRVLCRDVSDLLDYLGSIDIEVVFVSAAGELSCKGERGGDDREQSQEKLGTHG
jgi:hypothetical protein